MRQRRSALLLEWMEAIRRGLQPIFGGDDARYDGELVQDTAKPKA